MLVEQTSIDWSEGTHVHRRDPGTSLDAAERMERTGAAARQAAQVYDLFVMHGHPATSREISDLYGVDYHMVARRIPDLRRIGMIEATGDVRDGRQVWRVV